jgi:heme exporter protein B
LAAIAAKAQQNAAIMAILGFPIIIPQLLMLMKVSATAFETSVAVPVLNISLLMVSNLLVVLLAIILFPFLWKD